jgi:phosphocarrier protein
VTTAEGESALADSILSVLALGVPHGASVTIDVDGDDAEGVADTLSELLTSDMDAS